jgi:hypothetical protein
MIERLKICHEADLMVKFLARVISTLEFVVIIGYHVE